MTDYELLYSVRRRLEQVWRQADHLTRIVAHSGHYASEAEAILSRESGGKA